MNFNTCYIIWLLLIGKIIKKKKKFSMKIPIAYLAQCSHASWSPSSSQSYNGSPNSCHKKFLVLYGKNNNNNNNNNLIFRKIQAKVKVWIFYDKIIF